MNTIKIQTAKGEIEGMFCSEKCQQLFNNMTEHDRQQILLSEADYFERYGRVPTGCIFCQEIPK